MKRILVAFAVGWFAVACRGGEMTLPHDGHPDVGVATEFKQLDRLHLLHIRFWNTSDHAVCIQQRTFGDISNEIDIRNAAGKRFSLTSAAYPSVKLFHGFNYAAAHFILVPGGELDATIDLRNFQLERGHYIFSWPIRYFTCAEVLRFSRTSTGGEITWHDVVASGTFSIAP